eukprot:gene13877-15325_t
MPLRKEPKNFQPLWKNWDAEAQKKGQRNTVYFVNGDQYTGEWDNNKKNGKGTQIWKKTGAIYDGDWKDNLRNGFGTYSLPNSTDSHRKVYSGGWKHDKRHGYGTNFFKEDEYYEGEWYAGNRSGWGRMYYSDGSVYEGEWFDDTRNGSGMLRLVLWVWSLFFVKFAQLLVRSNYGFQCFLINVINSKILLYFFYGQLTIFLLAKPLCNAWAAVFED